MFAHRKEQKIFDIGGVNVGGQPGEIPTVLIGTIFYKEHKIVEDDRNGVFDRKKAETLINRQDELAEKTGNPCMIDVVGLWPKALQKYLDFVSASTEAPILMDGGTVSNNLSGLDYVEKSGLTGRVVYNSLVPGYEQTEIEKIEELGLESALLLALNTTDFTARGRVISIDALLSVANSVGIKKPLIDTCVLDIPTLGQACQALFELKEKYGLPVGCGAHNAVSTWKRLRTKFGERAVEPCISSAAILAATSGADFVLYGPIEAADYVFPSIGMVDAAYGQIVMEKGRKLKGSHPRFRIG